MNEIQRFCIIIRNRSTEHEKAINLVTHLPGIMASILRQELDSMIRVIYLLSLNSITERERLVGQTLNGENWTTTTTNGKSRKITDKDMVDISNQLHGWTLSVYKFGCAFIHLSHFHDYNDTNPFSLLTTEEQADIVNHLRQYHDAHLSNHPTFPELMQYFPKVFEKAKDNLMYYLEQLESNKLGELITFRVAGKIHHYIDI